MTKKSYSVWFETETGIERITVEAENRIQVRTYLRKHYPDDIGADGEITDPDGNEFPVEW